MEKSDWGDGPWQSEPDHKTWRDPATGLPCLAHRNPRSGVWCGYVAVPPGHPAHGKNYNDVDVSVHGGLTYGDSCSGPICHVPEPGEPDDVYWLGFDCHHCDDFAPAYKSRYRDKLWEAYPGEEYRTLEYVEGECTTLAAQLAQMVV